MIRVQNVKLQPEESIEVLLHKASKKLRIDKEKIISHKIFKQSLDARIKGNIFFIYTVDVEVENEAKILKMNKDADVTKAKSIAYKVKALVATPESRPVVVGFGPAGIFAALTLCQMGFKPIILERGKSVEKRGEDVEKFWNEGLLNISSNVQFGEGGAGTFSDGKLTARSKDIRSFKVFQEFINAGAPDEIAYAYNPHIGTDKLRSVVKNLRETILSLGGEIRFEAQVTDFQIENNQITGVVVNNSEKISCSEVVLAIGHSARDTFQKLYDNKVTLTQKPFAVGVRIEHSQKNINVAQYGKFAQEENLGAAEYKLTHTTTSGRGVYTFCMCPGGYVVAASSEEGMLVVNGMSYHSRNGENANSALLVQVNTADFNSQHPLAGIEFQRELEKKAFALGGGNYKAPAQYVGDFLSKEKGEATLIDSSYKPGVTLCNLKDLFPSFVNESMVEAITAMGKRVQGFDDFGGLLVGVESRSSSPVRIDRNLQTGESLNIKGLYPVGEGAGYAGGIVSAAIDGILAAEKILEKYM